MLGNIPAKIRVIEVGPRDGLQNEKTIINIEDKITYIKMLHDAGVSQIEATSFVRAPKIPQMSDGKSLFKELANFIPSEHLISLVPNVKGMEDALSVDVSHIAVFTSTSNSFNKKNINATIEETLVRISDVIKLAKPKNIKVRGYISTAFGCPYEGQTSVEEFIRIGKILRDLGVYEISIGDTIGIANPKQVDLFLTQVLKHFSPNFLSMHFHDTRGLAMANILTSLNLGLANFDSSSGGLGGCPYALGASGNVATEDMVNMFDQMGIETGIDLVKLARASRFILSKVGRESQSKCLYTIKD